MACRGVKRWRDLARAACWPGLPPRWGGAAPWRCRAAQDDTCRLEIVATVRLGPSAGVILQGSVPGELRGELSFALGADGAIDSGRLVLDDDTEFPLVGQATGRAINLRVEVDDERALILIGTAEEGLDRCARLVDGLLTGPQPGDLGDWHATATSLGSGGNGDATGIGEDVAAPPIPGVLAPTTVTGDTATATAAATSTASATETPTVDPLLVSRDRLRRSHRPGRFEP